jgi:hypothetical protein
MSETKLNPVEKRIAEGMNPLVAFLTEATCGEACWTAREDICRCSCGGKNHGCMRTAEGVRPTRTAKIDGSRYELKAVGDRELYREAEAINKANGPRSVDHVRQEGKIVHTYTYHWHETDAGAPARLKSATKDQVAKWPELSAYRDNLPEVWAKANPNECWAAWPGLPYLLWVKIQPEAKP